MDNRTSALSSRPEMHVPRLQLALASLDAQPLNIPQQPIDPPDASLLFFCARGPTRLLARHQAAPAPCLSEPFLKIVTRIAPLVLLYPVPQAAIHRVQHVAHSDALGIGDLDEPRQEGRAQADERPRRGERGLVEGAQREGVVRRRGETDRVWRETHVPRDGGVLRVQREERVRDEFGACCDGGGGDGLAWGGGCWDAAGHWRGWQRYGDGVSDGRGWEGNVHAVWRVVRRTIRRGGEGNVGGIGRAIVVVHWGRHDGCLQDSCGGGGGGGGPS